MKLFVLDNGTLELDMMWLMLNPTPATVDNKNPDNQWVSVPTYTVLVEHPQLGYVLFDGTCHPKWESQWPEVLQSLFPYSATDKQYLPAQLE